MLKTKRQNRNILKNEDGTATVETIPLMFIFVALLSYVVGVFGVVHTGILNSIAARTYAFETFRNRANVTYFRDNVAGPLEHFQKIGDRIHAINSEKGNGELTFFATERPIRMGMGSLNVVGRDEAVHMEKVPLIAPGRRNNNVEVSPVWVITQYGICINVQCGDR
jgi:hypothetical protein